MLQPLLCPKGRRGSVQRPRMADEDHNLPGKVNAWSTAPDKHHIFGRIFCEGGKNNDWWLQQKPSSPVAHKLHSSSLAMESLQSEVLQNLSLRLMDLCNFRSQHNPPLRLGRHAEGSN